METKMSTASDDFVIPQDWDHYTSEDHQTWDTLYARLKSVLPDRAVPGYLEALDDLGLGDGGVPDFSPLSDRLEERTGWRIVAVPGLVPDEVFFRHLANRRFPAGNFIRRPDQLDYIQEPDVFHDVFGHVPHLADPVFADYMQAYGEAGLKSLNSGRLKNLAALYWYTVEFGLISTPEGLRIYGAGIISSPAESVFALDSPSPHRVAYETERVMRTAYRIDDFQQIYFVIESFEDLLQKTLETDFGPLYQRLTGGYDHTPADILGGDQIITRGTQEYAARQDVTKAAAAD
ncbi:phenylalanine 4-monooxygenase [Parvularcula sp. LCG005]|uniref:phenylalanine 4-monooxygenase n=1 Tax=Parvularcula sp. LCG005 TaxID=3078805 RepID=UPI002943978B|nr:phenylalanine 4-monooxygenase [Parvularcula sp. LCG005]WOI52239.1 phenylalanine 4-monooxygenase [Parvularcula sp. LCG005]